MKYVGAHVSSSGGVENAPLNAARINAGAFAFFTKNQRRWQSRPLSPETVRRFKKNCAAAGYTADHILPHDSYLINLGHPDDKGLAKSRAAFIDEMQRCEQLGLKYLNFHPGSHLGKIDEKKCLARIAESINMALARTGGVCAVIENTAGQGSNMGFAFEHLAAIIAMVTDQDRIGICLDTCHLFAAGYDIRHPGGFEKIMRTFDETVGLSYLRAMHLNDSKKDLGTRVDRHASLGKGRLGIETFRFIMNNPGFDGIPLILETPDSALWADEIQLLCSL
ncbi:MAG: deoxyribonuclease IV [Deltaproteobacteria bacterium]|nr:MAG: deoxyribonuclease IV [Deltaproteobacteria bacterium]